MTILLARLRRWAHCLRRLHRPYTMSATADGRVLVLGCLDCSYCAYMEDDLWRQYPHVTSR